MEAKQIKTLKDIALSLKRSLDRIECGGYADKKGREFGLIRRYTNRLDKLVNDSQEVIK